MQSLTALAGMSNGVGPFFKAERMPAYGVNSALNECADAQFGYAYDNVVAMVYGDQNSGGGALPYSRCHRRRDLAPKCIGNHNADGAGDDICLPAIDGNGIFAGSRMVCARPEHGGCCGAVRTHRRDNGIWEPLLDGGDKLPAHSAALDRKITRLNSSH